MKLEKSGIDLLACPEGRRDRLFFDDELPGFCLRVTGDGAKVWLLQYRRGTKVHRVGLGRYPEVTPHQARKAASKLRGQVIAGEDPAGDRKAAREAAKKAAETAAFTLQALIDLWEKSALKDRRETYRAEATRALKHAFKNHLAKPSEALDGRQVQTVLDGVAAKHATTARRVRAYGRAAFGWAAKRQLVPSNPFAAVVMESREVSRDRVLSDAELGEAWRAAEKLNVVAQAFIRLAILTLQRRAELAGMRWSEVAADGLVWTVPADRAKNGKAHTVHLAEPAREILRKLPRLDGVDLVFATRSRASSGRHVAISGFSDIREQLAAAIAALRAEAVSPAPGAPLPAPPDWHFHDFRRTGVTTLARLGTAPHVADRILNHVQGSIRGVAAVYQRHEFLTERETALRAWAAHVVGLSTSTTTPAKRRGRSNAAASR